jgi:hypothetical protein
VQLAELVPVSECFEAVRVVEERARLSHRARGRVARALVARQEAAGARLEPRIFRTFRERTRAATASGDPGSAGGGRSRDAS